MTYTSMCRPPGLLIWIRIIFGIWIRIRIKVKIEKLQRLKIEPWMLAMKVWRVFRPVVADSHHFDEEQDPDPL